MIVDKQTEFSNAQAITVTAPSTNQYDNGPVSNRGNAHGSRGPDIAIIIDETFTAAGAATLEIQVRDSTTAAMGSPRVIARSPVFALADLVAGTRLPWNPIWPKGTRRFMDFNYVVTTGPFTAGKLTVTSAMNTQDPV